MAWHLLTCPITRVQGVSCPWIPSSASEKRPSSQFLLTCTLKMDRMCTPASLPCLVSSCQVPSWRGQAQWQVLCFLFLALRLVGLIFLPGDLQDVPSTNHPGEHEHNCRR